MSPLFVSRGFVGRRRESVDPARIPPGQYQTRDFPVLSAGPTPRTPLDRWDFSIRGAVATPRRWSWDELQALPREPVRVGAVALYGHAMGAILRCPACDNALLRIGRAGDGYWLDLQGLRRLRIAAPGG